LAINRDVASRLGITAADIDGVLYDAFGQRPISQLFTSLNQYFVIMEVNPNFQLGPNALGRIYVKSQTAGMVPLSELVTQQPTATPLSVNHQGQFPSVTLSFNLRANTPLGPAVTAINNTFASLHAPPTIQASFQGNAQAFQSSLSSTPLLIAAALVVIYIILGVLYESTIHPITILSTLPSAGIGALLILMAFHFDLSVIALIGIILLIGIVKKNAIMLIDFALEAERHQNMSAEQAIHNACMLRFRPILMTTMAALLGAVPLMVGTGTGSEIRQPLGYTIVGGLLLSQLLTLYTTPVVYLYLDRFRVRASSFRHTASQTPDTMPAE
jgi:HAE1 family hydrophobic/amphiphilic exporter-1